MKVGIVDDRKRYVPQPGDVFTRDMTGGQVFMRILREPDSSPNDCHFGEIRVVNLKDGSTQWVSNRENFTQLEPEGVVLFRVKK